jgi:hypothetical protein
MRPTFARTICSISLALALATAGYSQTQELTPDLKTFAAEFVSGVNAKDASRLLALYGSQSRACIAAEDKEFYNATLQGLWQQPIPANYTVTVSAVNESNLKAIESFGNFPVHPTRELHIDNQQGDDLASIVLYLIRENGRWVADQLCPTAEMVKEFHDSDAAREHYKAVAQSIEDPLRSELIDLLRKHETGSAIDRYHQATGQDMKTSMLVVDALQNQLP